MGVTNHLLTGVILQVSPWKPFCRVFFEWFFCKDGIVLAVYYQKILGYVMFLVFDFEGIYLSNVQNPYAIFILVGLGILVNAYCDP